MKYILIALVIGVLGLVAFKMAFPEVVSVENVVDTVTEVAETQEPTEEEKKAQRRREEEEKRRAELMVRKEQEAKLEVRLEMQKEEQDAKKKEYEIRIAALDLEYKQYIASSTEEIKSTQKELSDFMTAIE